MFEKNKKRKITYILLGGLSFLFIAVFSIAIIITSTFYL